MFSRRKRSDLGEQGESRTRFHLTRQQWVVAGLIGVATVMAAMFGWRAAAIGSTAAFDDRQSISETVKVEQQQINVALGLADDLRNYTQYLADYAVAAELDNQADAVEASDPAAAADARREAQALRRSATERAADAGLFGSFSIANDLRQPSPEPRPLDLEQREEARTVEQETGFDSPGRLDPDFWAADAESIRDQISGLVVWAFVLFIAVFFFTIGQVFSKDHHRVFVVFLTLGIVALLTGATAGFTLDWFA